MKNFLRVVRATLRRRYTFVAAVACSIGVAFLWGANLGLIKPIIEIVFADKLPHVWADERVEQTRDKVRKSQVEIDQIDQELAKAEPKKHSSLKIKKSRIEERLAIERRSQQFAEFVQPLVHQYLPNSTFVTLALFVAVLVVATLAKDAMLVGNLVFVERLTQLAMLDMRNALFRRTLKMELAHFGEGHSSHLMHRINSDVLCAFNGVNVVCGRWSP